MVIINGVDEIVLTKLDVLTGCSQVGICTDYKVKGKKTREFSTNPAFLNSVEPVIRFKKPWEEDISGVDNYYGLPENALSVITDIHEYLRRPINMVSVGPKRGQIIYRC